MAKFLQSLETQVYRDLAKVAKERGINVQELIRVEIVPTFLYGPIEFDKKTIKRLLKVSQNGSSRKILSNRNLSIAA